MRYIRKNKGGPLFRRSIKKGLNQGFYKKVRKEFPDLSFSDKDLKNIIFTFHDFIKEEICNSRDGVALPEGLGSIFITAFKPKDRDLTLDVQSTKDLNKNIYYKTWDVNGMQCKIYYTNYHQTRFVPFKNSKLWAFEASKDFRKMASEAFQKNYKKYVILDNYNRICERLRLFREEFRKSNKK